LEENNHPVYFHQFARRAAAKGLQYLGEAWQHSHTNDLGAEARQVLAQLAEDLIQREQYLDFLRNRTFRRTLLCHADVSLSRAVTPDRLARLRFAALARPMPRQADDAPEVERFATDEGIDLSTNAPLVKALLDVLYDARPDALTLDELTDRVAPHAGEAVSRE